MRRLAGTMDALAFLWSGAASIYLLTAAANEGIGTGTALTESGVEPQRVTASLASANGPWVVAVLVGVTLLAGVPMGVALTHPEGQKVTTWCVAVLLLGFSVLSGFSVGLFYLPGAALLVLAALATTSARTD